MDLTEDELIAVITRLLSGDTPGVVVGVGDDAGVLATSVGQPVLTTDLLLEGVHFERPTISAHDLGAKAVTVNVSDVAAMGASPRAALAAIGVPAQIETSWVVELVGGMREACTEHAMALVGGDTNAAEAVVVSVAVLGEVAPGRAVRRDGARPGDAIVVTGSLGGAAGGLALSRADAATTATALSRPWGRRLLDALTRPVARVGEGQILARSGAHAMIDLSDGLAKDLSRVCSASGVGARVELGSVPISEALRDGADALGVDALELALTGGEDYELLATMSEDDADAARRALDDRFGVTLTVVGTIIDGDGIVAARPDGGEAPLEPRGWDHFA
jgi:thiamine-monophosphate kinase